MSLEIPRRLPSLAHQIITVPKRGVKNDNVQLRLPPYPDINLNADGFTFSHLRWLGIKMGKSSQMTARTHRRAQVAILHELAHYLLAQTSFSRLINCHLFNLHCLIITTFQKEQKQILVPLRFDLSRNELEKQWATVVILHNASSLIQEVFAVRSSLRKARKQDIIKSDKQLDSLADAYKKQYEEEENIEGFGKAYEIFDMIARKIGEEAATGMILSVFETLNPTTAFSDMLSQTCKIAPPIFISDFLWDLDIFKDFISRYSADGALDFFNTILSDLDPDDSRYGKRRLLHIQTKVKQLVDTRVKENTKMDELLLGDPTDFVFSVYDNDSIRFSEIEGSVEVQHCDILLTFEAIRQQLTQGRGLQCPWWNGSPGTCCSSLSSFNRAFLEKVWSCTSDSACENWKRLGCLAC